MEKSVFSEQRRIVCLVASIVWCVIAMRLVCRSWHNTSTVSHRNDFAETITAKHLCIVSVHEVVATIISLAYLKSFLD